MGRSGRSRVGAIVVALCITAAAPAFAQDPPGDGDAWVFDETYRLVAVHDPGVLVLRSAEGEASELDFGYRGLGYAVVSAWPEGKTLRVRYAPEDGTEVIDPENGARWPIPVAWPRIDALHARCRSGSPSTLGMQACDQQALDAWDRELNRAYRRLMDSGLSEATKSAIRDAQRAWIAYRDAQLAALRAWSGESGGSLQRLQASGTALGLTKDQAGLLLAMDAPPANDHATGVRTAADDTAIFEAAGFRRVGTEWRQCEEYDPERPGSTPGAIQDAGDLDGDGRPEVIVSESSLGCYGMVGSAFVLVSRRPDGGWRAMVGSRGLPRFLDTRGVDRWPDLQVGGPGFCFPVLRWDGEGYQLHRHEYDGKPCESG